MSPLHLWFVSLLPMFIAVTGSGDEAPPQLPAEHPRTGGREPHRAMKPNRLINEKSPYLLQHAYNPVDWYPWGEEAFARARKEGKPIFLSVGYSTCHWCHVMEHESFENDSIAALLNAYFVCIKVDREERPDVDKIYMTALQAMGENGGWPMSMFLTPDLEPFFGGTYFPPESRYGRAGFPDILRRVHEVWETNRAELLKSAAEVSKYLRDTASPKGGSVALDEKVLDSCFAQFARMYDRSAGGFGSGSKFPRPVVFNFLLRYFHHTGNAEALDMTLGTLRAMSKGGVCDHLGGGFHRYAVDSEWRVPHFEKMLYDQAQLLNSYLDLFQITRDKEFAAVARDIARYVLRDMTGPDGEFFSAEDADSPRPEDPTEHGEGAFYVWTKKEIETILGSEAELFCYCYGVEDGGNAPFDPQHEFTGRNILYLAKSDAAAATTFGVSEGEVGERLSAARAKLLAFRSHRPRPLRDDKVIAAWNGLMIGALSHAFQVLEDSTYLEAAERAAKFVLGHMVDHATGDLLRRYRDGESRFPGHLDDYAFFVGGLLDLYEASFDPQWLEKAIELTRRQITLFSDPDGGFFDTPPGDSSLLVRTKEQYDGAEPAGSAVAAMNLLRLSEMTDNREWRELAGKILSTSAETLAKQPVAMPQMAAVLEFELSNPLQIIIAADKNDPGTRSITREVFGRYIPDKVVMMIDDGERRSKVAGILPFASTLNTIGGKPTAYVCQGYVCQLPTSDITVLSSLLARDAKPSPELK